MHYNVVAHWQRIPAVGRVFILAAVFFLTFLWWRPFTVPSEARYVTIALEMLRSGDWITPRLNGTLFADKPPLMYWLNAISAALFGVGEFSLRLTTALFAAGGCAMVYYAGNRLFSPTVGYAAAIILATSPLYAVHARVAVLDLPLSVAMGTMLLAMLLLLCQPRPIDKWLFAAGVSAAFLIKGLVAIVLPCIIMGVFYATWGRMLPQYRSMRHMLWILPLILCIVTPWHWLVHQAQPLFLEHYFIHEHFARFKGEVGKRNQPFWFFVPVVLAGFLPYTMLLPEMARFCRTQAAPWFLTVWIIVVFGFFSLSSSKLVTYILPLFMPLALLAACVLDAPASAGFKKYFYAIAMSMAGTLLTVDFAYGVFDRQSIKPLALYINQHAPAAAQIISYDKWYNDLPAYTQRTITMCIEGGQEMAFGLAQPNAPKVLNAQECAQLWQNKKTLLYVVTPRETYKNTPALHALPVLHKTPKHLLLGWF